MALPIVALGPILPRAVEDLLRASGTELQLRRLPGIREDDLAPALGDADALIVGAREAVTARVIGSMARCRVIARYGVGVDNIDIGAATHYGIFVTCVPDASVEEVSDHAVALLLACARRVVPLNQAVRSGAWAGQGTAALGPIRTGMRRLRGLALGLVGFGRIGQATWSKARAFGLQGLVHDPLVSNEVVRAAGAEPVGWEALLTRSDFISIHAPLTPETRGMFGREAFARTKATAFLINTARGAILDELALAEAIRAGRLAGAALDVTAVEPVPVDSPLVGLDSVLLTGHSGYFSEEANADLSRRAVEAILAVLRGRVPDGLVNPEVLGQLGGHPAATRP